VPGGDFHPPRTSGRRRASAIPPKRDPEQVALDAADGLISREAGRARLPRVALTADGTLDHVGTARLAGRAGWTQDATVRGSSARCPARGGRGTVGRATAGGPPQSLYIAGVRPGLARNLCEPFTRTLSLIPSLAMPWGALGLPGAPADLDLAP